MGPVAADDILFIVEPNIALHRMLHLFLLRKLISIKHTVYYHEGIAGALLSCVPWLKKIGIEQYIDFLFRQRDDV